MNLCMFFLFFHEGVLPIERPAGIEEDEFSKAASLVFHYGHNNPGANLKLYHTLVSKAAEMVSERNKVNHKSKSIYTIPFFMLG